MSKNIWLICKYAWPEKYFFGTRHFYLAEEWVKNGHNVTIFTSNSSHLSSSLPRFKGAFMEEKINGVDTIWVNVIQSKSSGSLNRLLSWVQFEWMVILMNKKRLEKPDVVIASSLSILSIISGYFFSKLYKAKFILEIRDIWPLSAKKLGGYSNYNPVIFTFALLEKFGYKNCDTIIGTMPNLIQHVARVQKNHRPVICIPQGITSAQLENQSSLSESYIKNTFTHGTFKIAYAGTVNLNNPISTLLEAVFNLHDNYNIEVYILGTGASLNNYIEKFGHCDRIKFISPIPKNEVKAFLSNVDVCYDSIDSAIGEFGLSRNKWIDYMNASKPIICSFNGFESIINEADCGTFVEFGNVERLKEVILKYQNMPMSKIKEIGENGRNYLMKYRTFDILAKDYELLF